MRNDSPSLHVPHPLLHPLHNVKVVENVIKAAVVGQAI